MKKIFLALLTLILISGCSPKNAESSAEQTTAAESTEITESVVSSAESSIIKEIPAESKTENKTESTVKEISTESKMESHEETKIESSEISQISVEKIKESSAQSSAESIRESSVEEKSHEEESVPVSNMAAVGFYKLTDATPDGKHFIDMEEYDEAQYHVTLEIFADGTGEFREYSDTVKIKWNDKYIITDEGIINYKLLDNKLALYSEQDTFIFEKTDKAEFKKQESSQIAELSGYIDETVTGRYILTDMTGENKFANDIYLTLNADGTGKMLNGTDETDIRWDDGEIEMNGEIFYYETDNNHVILDFYGIYWTFVKI